MRRIAGRGLLLTVLLAAAPLFAEPPPDRRRATRLAYTIDRGAEGCPDERALRSAVASRLGYDPWSDAAPRSIAANIRPSGGALRGEVILTDAAGAVAGMRQLTAAGDDCAELVAAMALAISIAVDPEVLFRPAPPPLERAPAPPSLLAAPLPAALPAALAPARPSAIRWHVGVGGFVAGGAAPGVTGGFTVQAGLRWKALSAAVEGRADVPTRSAAAGGGAVSAGLVAASLVPCFHLGPAAACGLGTFGALRGSGSGVAQPRDDVTPFAALGVRLAAEIPIGGIFSAGVHADVAGTLTRTTLVLDGRGVWTTPRASAALGAGVSAHFP